MRNCNPKLRQLEFEVVLDQVKRRREAFIKRLTQNLKSDGDHVLWTGSVNAKGYPRANFRYAGRQIRIPVTHIFVILQESRPIPTGYEAGHELWCHHRHCVKHVFLQHYVENVAQSNGLPF